MNAVAQTVPTEAEAQAPAKTKKSFAYDLPMATIEQDRAAAEKALADAKAMILDCPELYEFACKDLQGVKARYKAIEARRKDITKPIDQAKKSVMALFKPALDFLTQAETVLKALILHYDENLARKALTHQSATEQEAQAERDRLMGEARLLAAAGRMEEAQQLIDQADLTVAMPEETETSKAEGIQFRDVHDFEVLDIDEVPREYLMLNETMVRAVVKSTKGKIKIKGLRIFARRTVASSSEVSTND